MHRGTLVLWRPRLWALLPKRMVLDWIAPVLAARFMEYVKSECHFSNGTERVRFLERHIFNLEEYARFDSDVGEFQAVTERGEAAAQVWNRWKDALEQERATVNTFCRFNYEVSQNLTVHLRGV